MKIVMSGFLLALALTGAAQSEKSSAYIPMFSHSIGGSFQQFDGLNGRVAGLSQYEQLKDYAATLGLGWLKERNRVISEGGVMIGSSMSGHHDRKSSTIRYFALNIGAGYNVLSSDRLLLYPLVGLGYQGYQALFFKDNNAVAFDDVLESPTVQNNIRSVRFNNSFFVYRGGLGFAVRSPKNPSNTIGIQALYTGSFKRKAWKSSENQTLGNAPTDRINQVQVGLVFTGGPMMRMHR